MNYQHPTPLAVLAVFDRHHEPYTHLNYYAWPQLFGTTAGPRRGIAGQAMTTFTVEAYVNIASGSTVYTCAGMYNFIRGKFQFRKAIHAWAPLPEIPDTIVEPINLGHKWEELRNSGIICCLNLYSDHHFCYEVAWCFSEAARYEDSKPVHELRRTKAHDTAEAAIAAAYKAITSTRYWKAYKEGKPIRY
jgi:hypothetical protein